MHAKGVEPIQEQKLAELSPPKQSNRLLPTTPRKFKTESLNQNNNDSQKME